MTIADKDILKDLSAGVLKIEELERFLLRTYTAPQLAHELADYILEEYKNNVKPIVMTPAQFSRFFKVQGFRFQDGEFIHENRGNYSKK